MTARTELLLTMAGIDVHTHLAPDLTQSGLLPGIESRADGLSVDGILIGPAALYRPDALVDHLRGARLAEAVVSLPPLFDRPGLSRAEAGPWACAANDGLSRAVGARPELRPLAHLPLHRPDVALDEYRRRRTEPLWAGVSASVGLAPLSLADERYRELWQQLDRDAVTVLLHPGTSTDPRLAEFYLSNLLGNPYEVGLAAAQLIAGGVLQRFPRIRFVLAHCGGVLPAVIGRMQRGYETRRPGVPVDGPSPAELARRLWFDSVAFDPGAIDHAVAVFGADRLVLGSDWPFGMRPQYPGDTVAHLPAARQRAVAVDNPLRLLGRTDDEGAP